MQWDGVIRITEAGTEIALRSDDSSRLWIDIDDDGTVRVYDLSTKTLIAVQRRLLNMRPGKTEPWPAVWPVEGRDTLAWIDSTEHKLHWNQVIPNPGTASRRSRVTQG